MKSSPAFAALFVLLACFCGSIVLRGHVIYAHDNRVELGYTDPDPSGYPSNRKFNDQGAFYVPEIQHHLNGDHAGWLSTWNPHVELGRPSSQLSGFSPAFVITRVLGWLVRDPYVLYTWLALVTVVLTGLFGWLFLAALDLHPWACFAGASTFALGVFAVYWLTFVMFIAGVCWTLGIAWLVVRSLEKPTLARGAGLAFCVYALLMTAYPQQIVWHAYLLAGFTLARWWCGRARRARQLAWILLSIALGFACAAPVYADLAVDAARSTRGTPDPAFFLPALPEIHSARDLALFFSQVVDAFWRGNPARSSYPGTFNGICLTPLFAGLFLVSWLEGGWRRAGPWIGFVLVCLALTLWPAGYVFGVRHLGLSLSRFVPFAAAYIPMICAASIALDRLLRVGFRRPAIALAVAGIAPALVLAAHIGGEDAIDGARLTIGLVSCAGFAALVWTRKTWLVPALVVASTALYSAPLVLSRPESTIAHTSDLAEALRRSTPDRSRYAFVGWSPPFVLLPNIEALLGLRSIHSFDSLSSRGYQAWVLRLSEVGARTFGRHFDRIYDDSRLVRPELGYSGVAAVVSSAPLSSPALVDAGSAMGFHLYRTKEAPALAAQIDGFERDAAGSVSLSGPMSAQKKLALDPSVEKDDFASWRASDSPRDTLLFLSRQHHPRWIARSGGKPLETVLVNGFYLGVILPPHTREIELAFEPWTRWMWIVHVAIAAGAVAALLDVLRRRGVGASAGV